jgi:hypothetical protein
MTDSDNHIFEPDVVLSSEFFSPPSRLPGPERSLLLAVLEEAVRCFVRYRNATDRKQRALHLEARDWFSSNARARLFDFENVCDVLGINPEYMRERMFALGTASTADVAAKPVTDDGDDEPAIERAG